MKLVVTAWSNCTEPVACRDLPVFVRYANPPIDTETSVSILLWVQDEIVLNRTNVSGHVLAVDTSSMRFGLGANTGRHVFDHGAPMW
jgi:hypothetical protein